MVPVARSLLRARRGGAGSRVVGIPPIHDRPPPIRLFPWLHDSWRTSRLLLIRPGLSKERRELRGKPLLLRLLLHVLRRLLLPILPLRLLPTPSTPPSPPAPPRRLRMLRLRQLGLRNVIARSGHHGLGMLHDGAILGRCGHDLRLQETRNALSATGKLSSMTRAPCGACRRH